MNLPVEINFARRALLACIAAATAFGLAPSAAYAQAVSPVTKINEAAAKSEITVEPLRGGLSVLMGSGGNVTVLSGTQAKLMVDAGIAASQPRVEAALDKLGPGKIRYLITFDGGKVIMKHFGPGHTDSDIWVYFAKPDMLVLGDIFWNGQYPFIDNEYGGGINQAINWAEHALKQAGPNTIVVPGHGPVGNRAQLLEFRTMLAQIRENVAALKKQGKSRDEIIAAKPTAAFDAKFGGFVIDPDRLTRLVYAGL